MAGRDGRRWTAGLALVVTACLSSSRIPAGGQFDLLLRGGTIVDGTGNPRYAGDLGIVGDRITAIGTLAGTVARETLDVRGLIVAPGFIDMLGQSETNVLVDHRLLSKVTQGITTEVTGEGGSVAPLTDALVADDSAWIQRYGVRVDWRDLAGYFAQLERSRSTLNIATFVGATQVRMAVVGKQDRRASPAELARMVALVDTAMQQGALGLSTSLVYAPAIYAPTEELIALARAARRHGGIYATHIRNEGNGIDAALDEAFRIGRDAEIPVEIWHLKTAGQPNWGRMPRVLARIDSARAAGLDVTADQYPYTRSATSLDASIPQWAHSGGTDSLLARLNDPATRARIRTDMMGSIPGVENFYRGAGGADGILIVSTFADSLRPLQGRTLAAIARDRGTDPVETLLDIVAADRGRTGAVYSSMDEADVRAALRHWWVAVNTDAGGVAPDGPFSQRSTHPRAYGSFTRILGRYVREEGLLTLEAAVRKMTSLAAQRVGLGNRGLLRPGMFADITVFDAERVIDRATFERPHQLSTGIEFVLVNGQVVLRRGSLTTARPGRGLRGPGYRQSR
jgi:dihydroorotase/N-acyl-D-amino-acid deacylase